MIYSQQNILTDNEKEEMSHQALWGRKLSFQYLQQWSLIDDKDVRILGGISDISHLELSS